MKRNLSMVGITAAMLTKIGMFDQRKQIIADAIGRIDSGLKDLSHYELIEVQNWCKRYAFSHQIELSGPKLREAKEGKDFEKESADKMRKKIIYYAHLMGWQTPAKKADMDRINNWCVTKGQYKKALSAHTVTELAHLVSQFEKVYKSFLKEVYKK